MRNFIVTGTDTEVGKTYVSCLIVKALREAGINAAGFKPVACGDRQSTALIAAAGLGVAKVSLLDTALYEKSGSLIALFQWPAILLAIAIYFGLKKYKKHPVLYMAISAVCGIAFGL